MSEFWVGFDDERVAKFDDEQDAIEFAHFDSQLENTAAVVTKVHDNGTIEAIALFDRSGS